jgi:hypothetical protein
MKGIRANRAEDEFEQRVGGRFEVCEFEAGVCLR